MKEKSFKGKPLPSGCGSSCGTNVNIGSFNIRDHNLKLETIFKDLSKEEFLELTQKDSLEKFMTKQIEEIF